MDFYEEFPAGLQTFSHAFASQGCFIYAMCDIAWEWQKVTRTEPLRYIPAFSPLLAAKEGVSMGLVSKDGLMVVQDYPAFMNYLTSSERWNHRKESPGYQAQPGEYLIGRYSGILKVNPIKHYVRLNSQGLLSKDSMVNSPITKKGHLSSVHVFWQDR